MYEKQMTTFDALLVFDLTLPSIDNPLTLLLSDRSQVFELKDNELNCYLFIKCLSSFTPLNTMSVKVFRWILVITNLLQILIAIPVLLLSLLTIGGFLGGISVLIAFCATIQTLASVCFIRNASDNSYVVHFLAAHLLLIPLAFSSWLVVEQFLFREQPSWVIVRISGPFALIWGIQFLTELILSCIFCCSPSSGSTPGDDLEAAKKAKAEAEEANNVKRRGDDGTDEEKLVVSFQQQQEHQLHQGKGQAGPGGAFIPSPQAPPIEEVDEGDEEEEPDSQARDHLNDRGHHNLNHPHDHMPMRSISSEEKQHLIPGLGRPPSSSSGQCPLATPEDTGV